MNIKVQKKVLYDGGDKGYYIDGMPVNIQELSFTFRASDIQQFSDLLNLFAEHSFEKIIMTLGAKKIPPFKSFFNSEGISLAYVSRFDRIFILSYDEVQHSRYRVSLEGIVSDFAKDIRAM